jgi:hypothetical protein
MRSNPGICVISFGLDEDQFVARYRSELDLISPSVIGLLRSLFKQEVNSDVEQAHVEIFLDDYGGAPAVWIYYRGRNNKVDRKDQSLFAGRSLKLALPLAGLGEFDERYFTGDFRGLHLAASVLKPWLAECWSNAGGREYAIPTTLSVHDGFGDGKSIPLTDAAR